jgi:hypothetical protein
MDGSLGQELVSVFFKKKKIETKARVGVQPVFLLKYDFFYFKLIFLIF